MLDVLFHTKETGTLFSYKQEGFIIGLCIILLLLRLLPCINKLGKTLG